MLTIIAKSCAYSASTKLFNIWIFLSGVYTFYFTTVPSNPLQILCISHQAILFIYLVKKISELVILAKEWKEQEDRGLVSKLKRNTSSSETTEKEKGGKEMENIWKGNLGRWGFEWEESIRNRLVRM